MAVLRENPWEGPALVAGIVTGVIWLSAMLFGDGLRQSREPDPRETTWVLPSVPVGSPAWPPATSEPGDHVLVPWRLLEARYSTIPGLATVDGDIALGREGSFVITLTARGRDVPLDPCPDYIARWHGTETRRGLDCAGVPFRDASGAPYLPSGVPVGFEIALQFDTWELAAPEDVSRRTVWSRPGRSR